MKLAVFSTKPYDREFISAANTALGEKRHEISFLESRLKSASAPLAAGHEAVCAFVNDELDPPTLQGLAAVGVKLVALRCAGYNNVDLPAAERLGLSVARVPAYSPHAVAEHTLAMLLTLNRKTHRAFNRVREGNFELEGLLGFDLYGKTVGVLGAGRIGVELLRIFKGFGMTLLASDPAPSSQARATGAEFLSPQALFSRSEVLVLTCPLTPQTRHLINAESLATMRDGVVLLNIGRGALIDSAAVVEALKSRKIGLLGLDVYEEEAALFYEDHSGEIIEDDIFARLLSFPNVLITSHQAFLTREALSDIARTTLANVSAFERNGEPLHRVS